MDKLFNPLSNGEPAVLVHYVVLIGNHDIVRITHCRWRCCPLVMQHPLSLLLSMTYQLLLSMTYHCYYLWSINFKAFLVKTDCMELWVIKPTNQVSASSGFRVPHWSFENKGWEASVRLFDHRSSKTYTSVGAMELMIPRQLSVNLRWRCRGLAWCGRAARAVAPPPRTFH